MTIRLYRFYNMEKSAYGQPFALCDEHREDRPVPHPCVLEKIADKTDWICEKCGEVDD